MPSAEELVEAVLAGRIDCDSALEQHLRENYRGKTPIPWSSVSRVICCYGMGWHDRAIGFPGGPMTVAGCAGEFGVQPFVRLFNRFDECPVFQRGESVRWGAESWEYIGRVIGRRAVARTAMLRLDDWEVYIEAFDGSDVGFVSETEVEPYLILEVARHRIAAAQYLLNLSEFGTIDDNAAEAIAFFKGDVLLDGLTALSDRAAEALAEHNGGLSLNGISRLSDAATIALTKHREAISARRLDDAGSSKVAMELRLLGTGLPWTFDDPLPPLQQNGPHLTYTLVRERISRAPRVLKLSEVGGISLDAARAVADFRGDVYLDALEDLPGAVAEVLSAHHNGLLSLNGLCDVSDDAAKALADHHGDLELNGLSEISDPVIERLFRHCGRLSLNGLTSLSEQALAALSRSFGEVSLDGLGPPFVEPAAFARQKAGTLTADIVNRLLEEEPGVLFDGDTPKFGRRLDAYETIEEEAAKVLALATTKDGNYGEPAFSWPVVDLCGLKSLSLPAAAWLLRSRCILKLPDHIYESLPPEIADGLRRVTHDSEEWYGAIFAANNLGNYWVDHLDSVDAVDRLCWVSGGLMLDSVEHLTAGVAERLAEYNGEFISLNRLEHLSLEVARALASYRGIVYLASIGPLEEPENPDDCGELLQIKWAFAVCAGTRELPLSLEEIRTRSLSPASELRVRAGTRDYLLPRLDSPHAAAILAKCGGCDLSSVQVLASDAAGELAEFGQYGFSECILSLDGLKHLSPDVAKALARAGGWASLSLNGVEQLPVDVARALTGVAGVGSSGGGFWYGKLSLDGVKELSPEAATALVWHPEGRESVCDHLSLGGLGDLPVNLAAALAGLTGGLLSLNGLSTISEEAAEALARLANNKSRASFKGLDWASLSENTRSLLSKIPPGEESVA